MNHLPQGGNSTSGSGGANANNSNLNQQQFQEMMYNSFLNHLNQNKPASGSGASGSSSTTNAAATAASGTAGTSGTAASLAQQQKYLNSQPQQRYYSNPSANMINDPLTQQSYLQQQQQQQMFQQQQLQAMQQQGGQGSGSGNSGSTNTNSNSANYSPQYMHDQLQYHPSGNAAMQYNNSNGQFPYHPQSFQQGQQPQVAQYNQVNQDQMQQYQQQFNQQNQPNMQQAQLKAQQRTLQLNGDGTANPQETTKSGKPRKSHKKNQAQAGNNASQTSQSSAANQANHPKKLSSTQSRIEKRKQLKKQGPKRPSSAYFLFSMSIRNELLQQFPDAKVPELSKLASARWRELSDDEKKPYYDEFRTNWEKYRVLRDEYEKTLPPKRPSGPFIQFTQEVRPIVVKENPDKNLIEITKIIGSKWRDLDPVKKNEYTEMYKKRLKEWEDCYPEEAAALEQTTHVKKGRKKAAKTEAPVHDNTAAITDPNLLNAGNISVGVADLSSMVPKMETMQ
ncbi:Intrastrand cross-link recognition protein [Nakaseomyces bracarensis]|uniref:Intrastrand cross-link recognition protein n=1 Tax=Nakaseomyces bracarensis TaxID=273131 RepID=A0ABR4NQW8_9SACH